MAATIPDADEIAAIVRREIRAAVAELRALVRQARPEAADLSVTEAAAHLGVSTKTVRRWAREGRIRGVQRGRAWRFPRAGLAVERASSPEAAAEAALSALPR